LPRVLGAPLPKKTNGRYGKLRTKTCLEGGRKSKSKIASIDNDSGKRVLVRGKRRCKGCGKFCHIQTSYKCSLNGTKKRQVCLTSIILLSIIQFDDLNALFCLVFCRKRKLRRNTANYFRYS
jgi:hypothetical protein